MDIYIGDVRLFVGSCTYNFKMNDWVYLADKTKSGAEIMLIPDYIPPKKTKLLKISLDILWILVRLYVS